MNEEPGGPAGEDIDLTAATFWNFALTSTSLSRSRFPESHLAPSRLDLSDLVRGQRHCQVALPGTIQRSAQAAQQGAYRPCRTNSTLDMPLFAKL